MVVLGSKSYLMADANLADCYSGIPEQQCQKKASSGLALSLPDAMSQQYKRGTNSCIEVNASNTRAMTLSKPPDSSTDASAGFQATAWTLPLW